MNDKPLRTAPLNVKYAALQGLFWFGYCGLFSFAAVFLLGKGYTATQTGTLLALATLCSCLLQPAVASAADRGRRLTLRALLLLMYTACGACLAALLLLRLSPLPYALVYLLGALLLDLSMPLVNALCVYYNNRGLPVNFGIGRGTGSLFFAGASALFGFVVDRYGTGAMMVIVLAVIILGICVVLLFPRMSLRKREPLCEHEPLPSPGDTATEPSEACSLPQFFKRYRAYCFSLTGVLFFAAFHAMTENYLIVIMQRVGGGSSELGIALAIATVLEIPVIVLYSRFRSLLSGASMWLRIAAAAFLLKSVLLLVARSVTAIYCIQILQIVSYSLYAPTSVYFARESVRPCDMVKGQAMITSFYALGCSIGTFVGGRLLDARSITALLQCGVLFAAVANVILFISTRKTRNQKGAIPHDNPSQRSS